MNRLLQQIVRNGCAQYYWCTNGTSMGRDMLHCVGNLLFDMRHGVCKHANEVHCNATFNIQSQSNEPNFSSDVDKIYVWPDNHDSSQGSHNLNSDKDEWYHQTQVFLDNHGTCARPIVSLLLAVSLLPACYSIIRQ